VNAVETTARWKRLRAGCIVPWDTRSARRHTQARTTQGAHARPVAGPPAGWDARRTSQPADSTGTAPAGPRLPRALAEHLRSENVSDVVYGTVIGLALVVALEAHPPSAAATAATIVTTAVAVGLAELYSELVGARVRPPAPGREHARIGPGVGAVVAGAAFPAVFFILAAAHVIELDTAFTIAKWSGLGLIALYGWFAARLGGAPHHKALLHAGAVAAIGAMVIAIKALVH
jgi:hypothetical protein